MASSFAELESQMLENNDIAVLKAVLAKPMEARQPHELLAVANLLQNLNYFKIGVNDKKERLDFALKCSKYLKYSFFPKGYEVVRRDDAGTDFFIIYKGETHVFIPKGPKEFEEDFSNTHKKLAYEDYLAFAKLKVENTSYTSLPNGAGKEEPRRSGTMVRAETLGEVHLVHHKSKGAALRAKALDPESGIFNGPPEHDLTFDEKLLLLNNKANTYFLQGIATYKKVSILRSGDSFGELALLFNQPRTASVIASEDLHVLSIASSNYKGMFDSEISNLWKKIDFFRTTFDDLSSLMIAKFCYLLEEKKLTHNEIIYKEHDDADGIYIVKEGEVQLSKYIEVEENVVNHILEKKLPASRRKIIVANLQKGSFFGESEVINQSTREYTAMSSSIDTLVYRISKQAYMSSIQVYFSTIDNFLHQKAIFNENVRKQWLKKQQDILLSETGAQSERKNRKDYFGLDDYQFSKAKKGVTYVKRSQLLNQDVTIQKVQDPALYIKEDTNIEAISLMSPFLHKPGSPSKRLKPVVEVGTPVSPRKNRVRADEKATPSSPRPTFLVPRIPLKDEKPTITKTKEPEDFSYYLLPKLKTATSFANSPSNILLNSQTLESSRRDIEESPYIDIAQRKSPVKEISSIAKLELNDLPISISPVKNMHTAMRRQAGDGSPSSRSPRKATFRQSPTALRGISDYCFSAADTFVKQTPRKPVTEKKKSPTKIERSNTLHNVMLSPMVIQRVDHEYVDGDKLLSHRYSGGRLTHTRHNMFRTFKKSS